MFHSRNLLVYSTLIFAAHNSALAVASPEKTAVLDAPYWRIGNGFETSIMLNNTRPKGVVITPFVYDHKGKRLSTTSFSLGPMEMKSMELGSVLSNQISEGSGYIELQFVGAPVDVAAQVLISDTVHGRRWNHVFDAQKRFLSSHYEGVIMGGGDLPDTAFVLTNTSANPVSISFTLSEGSTHKGERFVLPPRNQRRIGVPEYLAGHEAGKRRLVGVTILHSGAPGDVIAQGLGNLGGGGSYNIRLFDSARLQSSSLISPVLALPWAHTSFLALRNISNGQSTVSLIAHYNSEDGHNKAQETLLQKIDMEANASTLITPQNYLSLLPPKAQDIGLEVAGYDTEGKPLSGQTIAELLLLADEGRQVIQATPKDPLGDAFPGFSQPWNITGHNQTVIALTNPSKTNRVGLMLSFHYKGRQYSYPSAMLEPGETDTYP